MSKARHLQRAAPYIVAVLLILAGAYIAAANWPGGGPRCTDPTLLCATTVEPYGSAGWAAFGVAVAVLGAAIAPSVWLARRRRKARERVTSPSGERTATTAAKR